MSSKCPYLILSIDFRNVSTSFVTSNGKQVELDNIHFVNARRLVYVVKDLIEGHMTLITDQLFGAIVCLS